MEYGAKFRWMRERAQLTQQALADMMNVSRSNISRVESGKVKLAFEEAIKWARNTNSQDVIVALTLNIDIPTATQMLSDSMNFIGTILLGGVL